MNTTEMRQPGLNAEQMQALLGQAADYIDAIRGEGPNVKYGCHCDLEPGMTPDDCTLRTGDVEDCVYAVKLFKLDKGPQDCEYYKPIKLEI